MAALKEAAKLWGDLDEANKEREEALKTVRAAEKEFDGLVTAKRNLEESGTLA